MYNGARVGGFRDFVGIADLFLPMMARITASPRASAPSSANNCPPC